MILLFLHSVIIFLHFVQVYLFSFHTKHTRKFQIAYLYHYWKFLLFALENQVRASFWHRVLTLKNTVILPNFLVWNFVEKAQFLHCFGRFARNYAEIVPLLKISTPENWVKLRYLSHFKSSIKSEQLIFLLNLPNMYPAFISPSNIDKGIKVLTNKIGDKLSPWKMPLFIFTSPSVSPPDVNSTFQFSLTFQSYSF